MAARIYQKDKSAMSSGRGRAGRWMLEYESDAPRQADPLMGWAGGADTQTQVQLDFATLADALAYAEREGVEAHVVPAAERRLKLQAYADNFR